MKIRILFGYLCFALSIALVVFQLFTVPLHALPLARALTLSVVTVVFLVIGFLGLESPKNRHLTSISVLAFLVCTAALVSVAGFAIAGPGDMAPAKYILLIFYAFMFGGFGLAASLLAHGRSVGTTA